MLMWEEEVPEGGLCDMDSKSWCGMSLQICVPIGISTLFLRREHMVRWCRREV